MNEKMRESLSALMDDEANELELERVLSQLKDEPRVRETWLRYSQARNAMHGDQMAHQAWESGALRVAIVDAAAAIDLAQSVVGPVFASERRCELDDLRRRAIDVDHTVRELDVLRALGLADAMLSSVSPT